MKQCEKDRAEIERKTAEFLANGGAVKNIPANMSAEAEEQFYLTKAGVPRRVKKAENNFGRSKQ